MRRRLSPKTALSATLTALTLLVTGAAAEPYVAAPARAQLAPSPSPAEPAPGTPAEPAPAVLAAPDESPVVEVDVDGFFAWAMLDRSTGRLAGSADLRETNSTESMIKVWLVADHLRRLDEAGAEPAERDLADARAAIRVSDNGAAERLYQAGGEDDGVRRMIEICGLADTGIYPGWWSRTQISAADAVRLGECVAAGRAAGPRWTDWVLAEMRQVEGTTAESDQPRPDGGEGGRWGIIDGLPAELRDRVAIKNGWTRIGADDSWHLNCLAITDEWVLAVLMRYPSAYSLDYGAVRCADVAAQLFGTELAAPG